MDKHFGYYIAGFYTFVTFMHFILTEGFFDLYDLKWYFYGDNEALGTVLIVLWVFGIAVHIFNSHLENKDKNKYFEDELSRLKSQVKSLKKRK